MGSVPRIQDMSKLSFAREFFTKDFVLSTEARTIYAQWMEGELSITEATKFLSEKYGKKLHRANVDYLFNQIKLREEGTEQ